MPGRCSVIRDTSGCFFRTFCLMTLFVALAPAPASADSASLSGRVTDPAGLPISRASVGLTAAATGVSSQTETNEEGLYSFPFLHPGEYRITISAGGFKPFKQLSAMIATGNGLY